MEPWLESYLIWLSDACDLIVYCGLWMGAIMYACRAIRG